MINFCELTSPHGRCEGAEIGCGSAQCGASAVHLDGEATGKRIRSLPVKNHDLKKA